MLTYFRTGQYYLNRGGPYAEFYPEVLRLSEGHYWVDYGYHLAPIQASHLGEMEALAVEHGVPSFKIFMFYGDYGLHGKADRGAQRGFLMLGEDERYDLAHFEFVLRGAAAVRERHPRLGDHVSVSLHCEIADILNAYTRIVQQDPSLTGLRAYSAARPPHSEGLGRLDRVLPRPRGGVPQRQPAPPLVPEGPRGGAPHAGHPAPPGPPLRGHRRASPPRLRHSGRAARQGEPADPLARGRRVPLAGRARREGRLGGERPRVLRHRDEARPESARTTCGSPRPASAAPSTSCPACSARAPGAASPPGRVAELLSWNPARRFGHRRQGRHRPGLRRRPGPPRPRPVGHGAGGRLAVGPGLHALRGPRRSGVR